MGDRQQKGMRQRGTIVDTYTVICEDGDGTQSEQGERRPLEVHHFARRQTKRLGMDGKRKRGFGKNWRDSGSQELAKGRIDDDGGKKVVCAIWPCEWHGELH